MSGEVTTDIPYDISTGDQRFELEEPLSKLQTMLNMQNVDIESLDVRGEGQVALPHLI